MAVPPTASPASPSASSPRSASWTICSERAIFLFALPAALTASSASASSFCCSLTPRAALACQMRAGTLPAGLEGWCSMWPQCPWWRDCTILMHPPLSL